MRRTPFAVAAALVAVARADVAPPAHADLPWVFDFDVLRVASSTDPGASLPLDLYGEIDSSCSPASQGAITLHADIGPPAGVETIVASYAHGIVVFDAEARLVASAPGYPCTGGADEIEAVAVGTAWGKPTIALVVTTGGRREWLTWVGLYRVGGDGRLEATFSGAVESEVDGYVQRGWVVFLPGALLHREPTGEIVLWAWKPQGFYVPYSLENRHGI